MKIIVIEGTDCSGKATQGLKLVERLNLESIKAKYFCFPNYDSPTGKIIGGPYLGKEHISDGWFSEGAVNVPSKVASLYYAADRLYNIDEIKKAVLEGYVVILDRYVYSNMAHQGSKISNKEDRINLYKWLEKLEFDLLELPRADIKIFLHVPYNVSFMLKNNREEKADQHESNTEHLINAENAYLELVDLYDFKKIDCTLNSKIKTIDEISDELFKYIKYTIK